MKKLTNEEFINKVKLIHGDRYDYSLVNYVNRRTKIIIICKEHGKFEQEAGKHLYGGGCKKCFYLNNATNQTMRTDDFITKANEKHGNRYNYSEVTYNKSYTDINIICPEHGVFKQTPNRHLSNHGCPVCKESKGEKIITNFLKDNNINYTPQKRFNGCKDIKPLPFDFYLPEHNICIEYHGIQHYEVIKFWGGENGFNSRQRRDKIKKEYCYYNNIPLIVIKYNENIFKFITQKLIQLIHHTH